MNDTQPCKPANDASSGRSTADNALSGRATADKPDAIGISPEEAAIAQMPDSDFDTSRTIDKIIVHCSATKAGADFSAADIRRWHLQRGFTDIGYHFVVRLDGSIEKGRPMSKIGAHCLNHNRRSAGVCYIGGLAPDGRPVDTRTPRQRRALTALLRRIKSRHPGARIHGHRDFAAKACPCFDATAEYANL